MKLYPVLLIYSIVYISRTESFVKWAPGAKFFFLKEPCGQFKDPVNLLILYDILSGLVPPLSRRGVCSQNPGGSEETPRTPVSSDGKSPPTRLTGSEGDEGRSGNSETKGGCRPRVTPLVRRSVSEQGTCFYTRVNKSRFTSGTIDTILTQDDVF